LIFFHRVAPVAGFSDSVTQRVPWDGIRRYSLTMTADPLGVTATPATVLLAPPVVTVQSRAPEDAEYATVTPLVSFVVPEANSTLPSGLSAAAVSASPLSVACQIVAPVAVLNASVAGPLPEV
jgi:hypothetical protein